MLYYRRKILLSLIQEFNGSMNHTMIQKLLFITTRSQDDKAYDFVPYMYGSFSFQARQDLKALVEKGLLTYRNKDGAHIYSLNGSEEYLTQISGKDRNILENVKRSFPESDPDSVIRYTYLNYPYFAVNSTIAKDIMTPEELKLINKQKRVKESSTFCTIGYEGLSIEKYMNKLIINDIRALIDVRKNPISRKYGFSKKTLKHACESLGISYYHIPELGIESDKRKGLASMEDYTKLFNAYEDTVLDHEAKSLDYLKKLYDQHKRVAITCFEAEFRMCHRSRIADKMKKLYPDDIELLNL